MTPYMGANFTVICNQTEPKTYLPQKEKEFQIPGFPSSKAKAENIVLKANGMPLANSNGMFIYEVDEKYIIKEMFSPTFLNRTSNKLGSYIFPPISFSVYMYVFIKI